MSSSNDNERLIDELANLLKRRQKLIIKHLLLQKVKTPDWPIWFADYLHEKMRQILKAKFTKSELI